MPVGELVHETSDPSSRASSPRPAAHGSRACRRRSRRSPPNRDLELGAELHGGVLACVPGGAGPRSARRSCSRWRARGTGPVTRSRACGAGAVAARATHPRRPVPRRVPARAHPPGDSGHGRDGRREQYVVALFLLF